MDAAFKLRNVLMLAAAACTMAACGAGQDDLDEYINGIKARPPGRIEPLPEIQPYEVFTYAADVQGIRSPFIPDTPQVATRNTEHGVGPDPNRSREFLEGFSLDTLAMVGTLYIGDTMYGLVQTNDGLIHRVVPGNYVGQNDGRITEITDSEIELVEIISDGIGGYIERDAAISLSD